MFKTYFRTKLNITMFHLNQDRLCFNIHVVLLNTNDVKNTRIYCTCIKFFKSTNRVRWWRKSWSSTLPIGKCSYVAVPSSNLASTFEADQPRSSNVISVLAERSTIHCTCYIYQCDKHAAALYMYTYYIYKWSRTEQKRIAH